MLLTLVLALLILVCAGILTERRIAGDSPEKGLQRLRRREPTVQPRRIAVLSTAATITVTGVLVLPVSATAAAYCVEDGDQVLACRGEVCAVEFYQGDRICANDTGIITGNNPPTFPDPSQFLEAALIVSPPHYIGICPKTVYYFATIKVGPGVRASYRVVRSDGNEVSERSLPPNRTTVVRYAWEVSSTALGSMMIRYDAKTPGGAGYRPGTIWGEIGPVVFSVTCRLPDWQRRGFRPN